MIYKLKKNLLLILIFQITYFFILFLKRNFFPAEIFFYESLNLLIIFFAFLVVILLFKKLLFTIDYIYILVISLLLSYSILITFPSLSKRSISLYMLEKIEDNSDIGISINQLEKNILEEFFIDNKEIQRRINEQLVSNNITIKNNKIYILNKGKKVNYFNRLIIDIFNLN